MASESWHVRRRGELETAAPKRRTKTWSFVRMSLWWAKEAAKATRTPKSLVVIELLWASWKAHSLTFALPSGRLKRYGLSRTTVWRTLQQLKLDERADREAEPQCIDER
jgi:hypothetical protein